MEQVRKNRKNNTIDMTVGSPFKNVLKFALPFALTTILQLLFNTVNMIVVGQFLGDTAFGSLGVTTPIISVIVNLFTGISAGVTVVIAKYFGALKQKDISETVHTAIGLSLVCGVILTLIGVTLCETMLVITNVAEEFMPYSKVYLTLYFCGMIPFMLYNFGSSILRGVGDTKRPLIFLSIGLGANVLTSLLLVGIFNMGVAGAGIATIVAQLVSSSLVITCLRKEHSAIRLLFNKIKLNKQKMAEILATGVPMGIQSTMMALSNVFIQSAVNSLGTYASSGNSAQANWESVAYAFIQGSYQGAVAFVAQNVGAGNDRRVHKSALTFYMIGMGAGFITGILAYLLRDPLVSVYISDSMAKEFAYQRSLVMIPYFLVGFMEISACFMVGSGRAVYASITNLVCLGAMRVLWITFVFPIPEFHSLVGIYTCYPITWILSGTFNTMFYLIFKKKITLQCQKNRELLQEI